MSPNWLIGSRLIAWRPALSCLDKLESRPTLLLLLSHVPHLIACWTRYLRTCVENTNNRTGSFAVQAHGCVPGRQSYPGSIDGFVPRKWPTNASHMTYSPCRAPISSSHHRTPSRPHISIPVTSDLSGCHQQSLTRFLQTSADSTQPTETPTASTLSGVNALCLVWPVVGCLFSHSASTDKV